MGMAAYLPPGWPAGVHPPGSEDFERTAVAWLLDVVPPDYRLYGVLRRHPIALAAMASHHVAACVEGARQGYRTARSELGEALPPHGIDSVLVAYRSEGRRLVATAQAVDLVARALRGEVFRPQIRAGRPEDGRTGRPEDGKASRPENRQAQKPAGLQTGGLKNRKPERAEGRGAAWTEEQSVSEPPGRGAAWTEERGTSGEGRRRLKAPRGEREIQPEEPRGRKTGRAEGATPGATPRGWRAGPCRRRGGGRRTRALPRGPWPPPRRQAGRRTRRAAAPARHRHREGDSRPGAASARRSRRAAGR